jgi:predicted RNA methylase
LAAAAPGVSGSVVVDPFAGSANTLYWIARRVGARRALAFELDPRVCESTVRNLAIVNLGLALAHVDYEAGLSRLRLASDELLIVFVAPPWGDALSPTSGLDLAQTAPPVPHIVDFVARVFTGHKVLLAVQVYETVVPGSLTAVTARCDWSTVKTYDFDAPGHNHGLLLGTLGWKPLVDSAP